MYLEVTKLVKKLLLFICCTVLLSCGYKKRTKGESLTEHIVTTEVADAISTDTIDENPIRESLNDIRFAGWGKKEWVDNEYIRILRKYIDAYNSGKIEDTRLDEYKDYIKGKFIIADIQPYIAGGAYISIIFYDHPDKIFSAVVYSYVDEKTRKVTNYEYRSLDLTRSGYDVTQEEIHQFLKECPEHKMW